jgi:hypothetical protein
MSVVQTTLERTAPRSVEQYLAMCEALDRRQRGMN